MHHLVNSDPVHKITIIPRGQALGYAMSLPEEDEALATKAKVGDQIVGLLGGRASEEMTFDSVTSGPSNDLQRATQIAPTMTTRLGMSTELGFRTSCDPHGDRFLGSEL